MLRELYPPTPIPDDLRRADVVVIPGVGTPGIQEWCDDTGSWLEKLHSDFNDQLQVLVYDHTVQLSLDTSVSRQLEHEGSKLLAALNKHISSQSSTHHPALFFICHSLGGIILKKALNLLNEQKQNYTILLDMIKGLFFLGTPHEFDKKSDIISSILRTRKEKLPAKHALDPSGGEIYILCEINRQFRLYQNFRQIYSCFEGVQSGVFKGFHRRIFSRPLQSHLITLEICRTGIPGEQLIKINRAHRDLCKVSCLQDDPLYTNLCLIVKEAIQGADLSDSTSNATTTSFGPRSLLSHTTHNTSDLASRIRQNDGKNSALPLKDQELPPASPHLVPASDLEPLTSFDQVKKDPHLPCFSVRTNQRNPQFFKRAGVFEKIDEALLPANDKGGRESSDAPSHLQSFAICGMGGVGKTQTAVEYAYSRRGKFEAVFWVSADDKNILTEQFAHIAVSLGLVEQAADLPEACNLVKGWLSNPVRSYNEQKQSSDNFVFWLLVFDNVDNFEVLEDLWPEDGIGSVLVTSRDPMARQQRQEIYAIYKGIDLRPLDTTEAVDFIKALTPQQSSRADQQHEHIEQIANILGGLPLLITKLPGAMSRLRLFSYKELHDLCKDGIEQINEDQGNRKQSDILTAQIGLKGLSQESLGLLQMISLLDPDRIPEMVLRQACLKCVVPKFPKTMKEYYGARSELLRASLVEHNQKTDELSLHRIVQAVARDDLAQPRRLEILESAVQAVSQTWPFGKLVDRFNTNRYQDCAIIFPSVIRLKAVQEDVFATEKCYDPDTAARLLNDAGWYWFERGYPDDAKEFWKLTELLYSQAADDAPTKEMASLLRRANLNHATASLETNDREDALARYKHWLESAPSVDGPEGQYELACIYNETGVAYAMNEMYDEAISYFQKSIDSFQDLPDYEDTMLDWPLPNLGFMYWVQGRYDDAEKVLHEILDIMRDNYGPDDTESFKTGKILYALGNVYSSQGEYEDGFRYHTRCLKQYRATLGDGHHRVGDVSHRLADHNIRRGNFVEASTMINQAMKIFSTQKQCKNELARTTYKMGQMLEAMGKESEALGKFQEAFNLRRNLVPRDGRKMKELIEEDYDKLVIFWSR